LFADHKINFALVLITIANCLSHFANPFLRRHWRQWRRLWNRNWLNCNRQITMAKWKVEHRFRSSLWSFALNIYVVLRESCTL